MKTEQKEKLLETVHGWIQATDQKISIFLAFLGIILTTIINPLYKLYNQAFYHMFSWKISFCILCAFLLMISASVFALWGLRGRLRTKKNKNMHHNPSFLFFNDIASLNFNEFRKLVNNTQTYEKELESQIYFSSKIGSKKLRYFNLSIYCFLSSLGFLALAVINYIYVIQP